MPRPLILTDEEKATVRLLEARGESENFIRGYIRAGRTFGFTKLSEEDIAMTKRKTSTDATAAPRKRKSRAKAKPVTVTTKGELFNKALPIIAAAFKALENPKKRPHGFGRDVMATLMKELNVTKPSADQLYYKAMWEYPQELGL